MTGAAILRTFYPQSTFYLQSAFYAQSTLTHCLHLNPCPQALQSSVRSLRFTLTAEPAALVGHHFYVTHRFRNLAKTDESKPEAIITYMLLAKLIPEKKAQFPILEMTASHESRQFSTLSALPRVPVVLALCALDVIKSSN